MLHLVCGTWARDATAFYLVTRPKDDTSPNRKPASCSRSTVEKVAAQSPKKKRRVADPGLVPERVKRLDDLVPANKTDIFTQMELTPGDQDVVLVTDAQRDLTLGLDGEMLQGYIRSQLASGAALDEVEVDAVKLSLEVWFTYLTRRNKFADRFSSILEEMAGNMKQYEETLQKLQADEDLYMRMKFFIKDLSSFGSDEEAQERLEHSGKSQYFFTTAYFSEEEIARLLELRVSSGKSVNELLGELVSDKGELCTSHDVAPLLQKVFGIKRGFQEDAGFKHRFKAFRKQWTKKNRRFSISLTRRLTAWSLTALKMVDTLGFPIASVIMLGDWDGPVCDPLKHERN
ncbi:hypothetical protein SELMODRAFT_429567 [Selaginella moellendorffii]|uniref:Uncharacterized protein n=1 Tax=Selaginella moellendorffii TaxID=88036 RepID=D8T6L3_SELML|nr:hypothetical protein SELMODRAFT_429567 [Selaginella moellendorffii]